MKRNIYLIIAILAGFLAPTSLSAQNDMIIQGMNIIPQSYYSNPAFVPQCKIHASLPGLSSVYIDGGHNGFNANNVLSINVLDSVVIDMESLINSLGKNNYVFMDVNEEILSFGFKFKEKHYFNVSATERLFARVSYPKDLLEFAFYGNGALLDQKLDIGNFRVNASHYREYAFGYSYLFSPKWTFGARAKVLFGKANINTKKTDITFETESDFFDITVTSDILVNTNELHNMSDSTYEFDAKTYLMQSKNFGMGFDFGATYKYDDKLTFGLSVLDLGFISWKSDPMNLVSHNPGSSFTYDGVDITEFVNQEDSLLEQKLENTIDSIAEIFKIDTVYNKYSTTLNTKLQASAFYSVTKNDKISAMARVHFYDKGIHPAFSLGYMHKFGDIWHVTGTYSIANRNFTNFGLGFSLKLGFFQLYMLTDNVFGPIIWNRYKWTNENSDGTFSDEQVTVPRNWKYMNFHFGINFVFGCKPPKDFVPIID